MKLAQLPLVALTLALSTACGDDPDSCPDVDPATWLSQEPDSYVYASCGTGFSAHTCTAVVVEDGVVTQTASVDPDDVFEPIRPEHASTLADGFGPYDCSECEVRTTLDTQWGYVSDVYYDCGEEGWGSRVSCFAPNTTDISVCQ